MCAIEERLDEIGCVGISPVRRVSPNMARVAGVSIMLAMVAAAPIASPVENVYTEELPALLWAPIGMGAIWFPVLTVLVLWLATPRVPVSFVLMIGASGIRVD